MQPRPPSVTLIVAATINNGIGRTGRLPWRLSKEMAYFAQVTSFVPPAVSSGDTAIRNSVIMGRKTWESIPARFRPLKERVNIVISRAFTETRMEDTVVQTNSIEAACAFTPSPPLKIHRRFLIGGAELYRHALTNPSPEYNLDRILLTRILEPAFPECDVRIPEFRSDAQMEEENAEGDSEWRKAPHDELSSWVGFEVPSGVQEEKGVKYQFQMWVRTRDEQ